jgi:phage baseplate assembly protein V
MISRAIVGLVNDAFKMQTLQVTLFAGQTPDEVERFQNYGLSSVPHAGAEGIALKIGGSTGHTVVVSVDDRRFRMTGLADGEVALHDDLGHIVHLTRNGIVINGAGHLVKMVNLTKLRVEAGIDATGEIRDRCDQPESRSMHQMRNSHAAHTHQENDAGGQSGTPTQPL